MPGLKLTMAIERYDRHMPFFDGTAKPPPGVRLEVFQVGQSGPLRDGGDRHARMLNGDFDIAEFSMSSYLMAIDRGLPITGVPVFPRRLFSASGMFVRPDSDITEPRHLVGRKVALSSFQTTLSLLAKGDLKFEYGTPWEEIHWFVSTGEKVAFTPKPGVKITRLPKGADLGELLEAREIDCMFMPHPPHSVMSGRVKTRRLFPDTIAEEQRYFRTVGYYPIMHILALRRELAEKEPWIGAALMDMFAQAMEISDSYYEDPNWSRLAWGRHYYERERELLGDAWKSGFAANRKNLERFIEYSHDQGLIGERYAPERLFMKETLAT
jgi:4,5-dihydroxyphthalate decarboxylase